MERVKGMPPHHTLFFFFYLPGVPQDQLQSWGCPAAAGSCAGGSTGSTYDPERACLLGQRNQEEGPLWSESVGRVPVIFFWLVSHCFISRSAQLWDSKGSQNSGKKPWLYSQTTENRGLESVREIPERRELEIYESKQVSGLLPSCT